MAALILCAPALAWAETFFESVQASLTCTTWASTTEKAALGVNWIAGKADAQRSYFSGTPGGSRAYHFRFLTLLQAVANLSDEVDDQVLRREALARIIHYTGQDSLNARADLLFRQIHRCAWAQLIESALGAGDSALVRSALARSVATYEGWPTENPVEDWPVILAIRDLRRTAAGVPPQLAGLVAVALRLGTRHREAGNIDLAQRMWVAAGRGLLELGRHEDALKVVMAEARAGQPAALAHRERWRAFPVLFDYFQSRGKPGEAARLDALFAGHFESPDPKDSVGNFEVFHRLAWAAGSQLERYFNDAGFRARTQGAEVDRLIGAAARFAIQANQAMSDFRISLSSLRRAQRSLALHAYEPDFLPQLTRANPDHAAKTARTYLDLARRQISTHLTSDVLVSKRTRLVFRSRYSGTIGDLARLLPYLAKERGEVVDTTFQLAQVASHSGAAAVATSGLMGLNRDGVTRDSLTWNLRFIENPAAMLETGLRRLDAGNVFLPHAKSDFHMEGMYEALALLRSDVFENRKQFAALIYQRAPQLAAFLLGAPLPVSTYQKFLGPHEAIVATHVANDAVHVWVVTRREARLVSRPIAVTELDSFVDRVRASIDQAIRDPFRDSIPYDAEAAWRLFGVTFGPVMEELKGSSRVYWYGDKMLGTFPPAILLTAEPVKAQLATAAELKAAPFLAREFPLISMPELSIYALVLNPARGGRPPGGRTGTARDFLGIGGTQLSAAELGHAGSIVRSLDLAGATGPTAVLADLPKLSETVATLRAIEQTFGAGHSTLWLGPEATKKKLRESDLRSYRVLVLATHGFLAGEMAACGIGPYPSLLMSQPGGAGGACRDALLTTREISQLKLDADLVVLSACNTARSGSRGGAEEETFFGLTAAFSAAGARNLAVSHWPVMIGAASDLTAGLIRRARTDGVALDAALQSSIEQLRTSAHSALEAHPAYWGPFVLVGSGRTTFSDQ